MSEKNEADITDEILGDDERPQSSAMEEEEFASLVRSQIEDAIEYIDDYVSPDRSDATRYYRGDEFGGEVEGRSRYVSRDLRDTVQAILPSLLKIFHSSSKYCEFIPRGPEDVPMAEQATDYVRYVLEQDNRFFMVLHSALKDSLVRRNGFIKATWQEKEEVEGYQYSGLDEQALAALLADSQLEVVDVVSKPMPGVAPTQFEEGMDVPQIYDVSVQRRRVDGKVVVEALPPEEVLIDRHAKSLDDATLVAHRRTLRASELIAMGYAYEEIEDFLSSGEDPLDLNAEYTVRKPEVIDRDAELDNSQRNVHVVEAWLRIDYDGDGITELRHIIMLGPQQEGILLNEPCNRVPIFTATPDPEPHTWNGLSLYDILQDIQKVKSAVMRSILDSLALSVHPRLMYVDGQVDYDSLLDSDAVGALIRARSPNAVVPLQVPFSGGQALPILELFDTIKENRTGISKASLGLDAENLQSTTRAAVIAQMSASQTKIELIARIVAEQMLRPLYRHILRLICEHQQAPRMVRLRNQFVPMDPRTWDAGMDVTINVALGQSDEDQRMASLMSIKATQEQILMQLGPQNPLCTLQQYHNTLAKIVEQSGFRDSTQFFTDPSTVQMPPPEPPKPTPEEMLAQIQMQSLQTNAQLDAQRLQLDAEKMRTDAALKQATLETETSLKIAELSGKYQQAIDVQNLRGMLEQQRELIRQQGLLETARINSQRSA